jgi:hypothetical protein
MRCQAQIWVQDQYQGNRMGKERPQGSDLYHKQDLAKAESHDQALHEG